MQKKALPPVWLMGMATLTQAMISAICLVTVPQLLSAAHVPETRIAQITGLALIPAFCGFIFAPILDVRFSRRTYAILFAALAACCITAPLFDLHNLALLTAFLFGAQLAGALYLAAVGGWFSEIIPREREASLSAWFIVAQVGGFGSMSFVAITLLRELPYPAGALLLGLLIFLPTAILALPPAPVPDRRPVRESFGQFAKDLSVLIRQKVMLQTLLLFSLPPARFALTNALGGLGRDYGASEKFVGAVSGIGVTVAGVLGSLIVPLVARYVQPRPLFLLVGGMGAAFTLAMSIFPRTPTQFAIATIVENVFWAAGFTVMVMVTFRAIGKSNPFASTQYALILSVASFPLVYMQLLDGYAYGLGGLTAMFMVDGGGGLVACGVLAILLALWSTNGHREPASQ
jgi:PAT family beta-lactamase induction signal transducer AmpG